MIQKVRGMANNVGEMLHLDMEEKLKGETDSRLRMTGPGNLVVIHKGDHPRTFGHVHSSLFRSLALTAFRLASHHLAVFPGSSSGPDEHHFRGCEGNEPHQR